MYTYVDRWLCIYIYIYIIYAYICMGHGLYLVCSSIYFYVQLCPHGFPARDDILPHMTCSPAAQSCEILGQIFYGTEATTSKTTTNISQPLLSPTIVVTIAVTTTTTDESCTFTSFTFSFWGMSRIKSSFSYLPRKSRKKAPFSHLPLSVFEGSLARNRFSHPPPSVPTTRSGNIWALPCLALAYCSSWTKAHAKKALYQRSMGQHLADRDYVILGYRCHSVIVWDTWLE